MYVRVITLFIVVNLFVFVIGLIAIEITSLTAGINVIDGLSISTD